MGAKVSTHQKNERNCTHQTPLVLFRDRMVTNCLMNLRGLYYIQRKMSKEKAPSEEGAFSELVKKLSLRASAHAGVAIRSSKCSDFNGSL